MYSPGSAMLMMSPVTAMWSGAVSRRSAASVRSTPSLCTALRRNVQVRNPVARLPASSSGHGRGSGPTCGSDRWARVNIPSRLVAMGLRSSPARHVRSRTLCPRLGMLERLAARGYFSPTPFSRPRLLGKEPMTATSPAAGPPASSPDKSQAAILVGRCDVRLWGLTPQERCRRALARSGIDDIRIDGAPPPDAASVVLLRTDFAIDETLIKALVATPETLLMPALHDGRRAAVAAHVAGAPTPELAALLRRETATAAEAAAFGLELV